ncbi:hypothetical protein [Amycolatopsis solani]|uniref:hypothetical protein n=2 Tax=Amycolatopsis solani TaxID=3028615 RepID=UPI00296FBA89|nr:hypothetical protein [Amycolatopsis sp. MEP2-6]
MKGTFLACDARNVPFMAPDPRRSGAVVSTKPGPARLLVARRDLPEVLNESFKTPEVLNDSFKTFDGSRRGWSGQRQSS